MNHLLYAFLCVVLLSCGSSSSSTDTPSQTTVQGVWSVKSIQLVNPQTDNCWKNAFALLGTVDMTSLYSSFVDFKADGKLELIAIPKVDSIGSTCWEMDRRIYTETIPGTYTATSRELYIKIGGGSTRWSESETLALYNFQGGNLHLTINSIGNEKWSLILQK